MTRQVIINADDFGLSGEVNQAVVRAHRAGVLSSASLLVNAPGTADAVALARELPNLGLGIHLALTELAPLTRCPHLAPGGRFAHSHGAVYAQLLTSRVPAAEVRAEVEAQLTAALATGLPFDHLDSHGHVHVLPVVWRALAELGPRLGLTRVRWPREDSWEVAAGLPAPPLAARLKRTLVRRLCHRLEPATAGWVRPTHFYGLASSGQMTTARLRALAAALPAGSSEIMVHPATVDQLYPGYLGAQELAALLDAEVGQRLPARQRFAELPG